MAKKEDMHRYRSEKIGGGQLNSILMFGDCMESLPTYRDNYFDLAVVDVPYGINESGQTNKSRSKLAKAKDYGNKDWDKESPDKEYFDQLFRVSKNQIVFGANHFISKMPYDSSSWIVWDKENGSTDYADCELAWTSFKSAVRKFSFRWQGMLQGNMKDKEERIHPTQKPAALYRWILRNYADTGQKILDTHAGSGSLRVACHDIGVNYIGMEIDRDYYNDSVKRFKEHVSQLKMF